MIHSVFNWKKGEFDYFRAPVAGWNISSGPPTAPKKASRREIGVAPEEVAHTLPRGAKYVGSGPDPVGLVAVGESPDGLGDVDSALNALIVPTVIGLALYFTFRK